MPRSNLELAQGLIDAVAAQDLNALLELTDPQIVWRSFFAQLRGEYRGHDGIRRYVEDLNDSTELLQLEIEDSLSFDDLILLVGSLRFRGKESGVESQSRMAWVVRARDGRATLMSVVRDPKAAFESLGD